MSTAARTRSKKNPDLLKSDDIRFRVTEKEKQDILRNVAAVAKIRGCSNSRAIVYILQNFDKDTPTDNNEEHSLLKKLIQIFVEKEIEADFEESEIALIQKFFGG